MNAIERRGREAEAIAWHVRLADANESDWIAFEVWLAADRRNVEAYDSVAALDDDLGPALHATRDAQPRLEHANDDASVPLRRYRWWLAGGLSAGAAVAVALLALPKVTPVERYAVVTGPGERRTVTLDDGTQIALNGSSRISLDRRDKRFAALESGEATFIVQHDPARPFALTLGNVRVVDTGTVFNVVRTPKTKIVEVRSGGVIYDADNAAVPVKAGQALKATGDARVVITPKEPADIASWREGRLEYDMQSYADIAQDLTRNLGTTVVVDPTIGQRRFTGSIALGRDHGKFFGRLGALLGIHVKREGEAWRMSAQ